MINKLFIWSVMTFNLYLSYRASNAKTNLSRWVEPSCAVKWNNSSTSGISSLRFFIPTFSKLWTDPQSDNTISKAFLENLGGSKSCSGVIPFKSDSLWAVELVVLGGSGGLCFVRRTKLSCSMSWRPTVRARKSKRCSPFEFSRFINVVLCNNSFRRTSLCPVLPVTSALQGHFSQQSQYAVGDVLFSVQSWFRWQVYAHSVQQHNVPTKPHVRHSNMSWFTCSS